MLLGGSLLGQNWKELLGEFSLVRRLRPGASKVVMHHSLSYASEEDPSDLQIMRDTARYLEHLGLKDFPHVVIRHADKEHLHPHIVISKIGFGREWWDARLDHPRAQVSAALVEREFGLVEPERPKMKNRIEAAWARLGNEPPGGVLATPGGIRLPAPEEVLPPPQIPAEKIPPARPKIPVGDDGNLQQIRARMEEIPAGLSLPEWVHAMDVEGIQIRPSMGGEKISGWWVQLTGSDVAPVKLSAVDRARSGKGSRQPLGWAALQKVGAVIYDPQQHNKFAKHLAEVPFDRPYAFSPEESRIADEYPRNPASLAWDWQPGESVARPDRPGMVGELVEPGPGPRTPRPRTRTPDFPSLRRWEKGQLPARPSLVPNRPPIANMAPGIRALVAGVSRISRTSRVPHTPEPQLHVGGGLPIRRPGTGPPAHPGQSPSRSGPVSRGRHHGTAPSGHPSHPDLHRGTSGRIPAGSRRSQGSGPWGRGDGMRLDRGGVEALRHQKALEAARTVIYGLPGFELKRRNIQHPPPRMLVQERFIGISPEVRAAMDAAVRRFFSGEFIRVQSLRSGIQAVEGEHAPKKPRVELVLEGEGQVDFVSPTEKSRRAREEAPHRKPKPGASTPSQTPSPPELILEVEGEVDEGSLLDRAPGADLGRGRRKGQPLLGKPPVEKSGSRRRK